MKEKAEKPEKATKGEDENVFQRLSKINVNDHTEKKKTGSTSLTYLSWAWAWGELMKIFPDATYEVTKYGEQQLPYIYDPNLGYMCHTTMTIAGITREMWLPVMDGANNAMKSTPYEVKTKFATRRVEAATMFDINKTIMRCLVKNIGMFGLGLYIYAGEDLPEGEEKEVIQSKTNSPGFAPEQLAEALKGIANAKTEDKLVDLWNYYAQYVPALAAQGTEFFNKWVEKRNQLAQQQ